LAPHLPYVRRYARALTGDQNTGDQYVRVALEALAAGERTLDPGMSPRVALYHVFHAIWCTTGAKLEAPAEEEDSRPADATRRLMRIAPRSRQAFLLTALEGFTIDEAAQILDAYFTAVPAVRDYMDRTVAEARERGYTETLFGRRRPIPELASSNFRIRQAGERQAMNAGIQGLAADIFKVALVRLDARLAEEADDSRLILQVHDEVLLEVPPKKVAAVGELVTEVLSGAAELRVPLEVNLSSGDSWADAKG
jgi:DNA-directed RNA polymerase specialized sigma24 family protein